MDNKYFTEFFRNFFNGHDDIVILTCKIETNQTCVDSYLYSTYMFLHILKSNKRYCFVGYHFFHSQLNNFDPSIIFAHLPTNHRNCASVNKLLLKVPDFFAKYVQINPL